MNRRFLIATTYAPAAVSLFSRMTTPPTVARKRLINQAIRQLQASGIWGKLAQLYVFAAADAQAAKLDWKGAPGDLSAPTTAPTFAINVGFSGNGASAYLQSANSPTIAQNSNCGGVWRHSAGDDTVSMSWAGGSLIEASSTANPGHLRTRISAGTSDTIPTGGVGHAVGSRTASAGWEVYRAGASVRTVTAASSPPSAAPTQIFTDGSAFSGETLSAAHVGDGLSAAEVAILYAALHTYLVAVGAA